MRSKNPVDFSKFEKALSSLEAALIPPPANDRERDGAIQRFEYTFEITWKIAKIVLALHGIDAQSPRTIYRELAKAGWINNPESWFKFLESRNKTSHNYEAEVSASVFADVPEFATEAKKLLVTLKKKSKE
jgi:nucleotidyltransferase substrate binding protein (TIGR01987 family)